MARCVLKYIFSTTQVLTRSATIWPISPQADNVHPDLARSVLGACDAAFLA